MAERCWTGLPPSLVDILPRPHAQVIPEHPLEVAIARILRTTCLTERNTSCMHPRRRSRIRHRGQSRLTHIGHGRCCTTVLTRIGQWIGAQIGARCIGGNCRRTLRHLVCFTSMVMGMSKVVSTS